MFFKLGQRRVSTRHTQTQVNWAVSSVS